MAKTKYRVNIEEDEFLPVYRHTIGSDLDVEFLYGSRDSGKSRHIAQILVTLCMAMPKFICPMVRKVANTVKDSQWSMIKAVVTDWGLLSHFQFLVSPLEIRCSSGGVFLARGMDDAMKIKSLTNPTHAWVEEGTDLIEDDWTILTTSLRSNDYKCQIWFSFNPDVPGLYKEHWLWKRYFAEVAGYDEQGRAILKDRTEMSFTCKLTEVLDDELKTEVTITYRATHSTFYDNPYCSAERKAIYIGLKKVSEYHYLVYAQGKWGIRRTGGEWLRGFQYPIHVKPRAQCKFDPTTTIHASLDSNVYPYISVAIWQLIRNGSKWIVRQIGELDVKDPENTASQAGRKLGKYLQNLGYTGKVFLYGDRSTKSRNNIDEEKRSFFQIFEQGVRFMGFATEDRFMSYAPPVAGMGDFVNAILSQEESVTHLANIEISDVCTVSIGDYLVTKTDKDGGLLKVRIKVPDSTLTYEANGHFTDTFKDFIVSAFYKEYQSYLNRLKKAPAAPITKVSRQSNITL